MNDAAKLDQAVAPVLPDYGTFARTPEDGTHWIHPEDVAVVQGLIPGERVFCRFRYEPPYYHYRYGEIRFRLRPCMWLPLRYEGIDIGDQVETIGVGMQQELFVSTVTEMLYGQHEQRIRYRLARTPRSDQLYHAEQLRLLTDKTQLRPRDTPYRQPQWDRQTYPPSDLHLATDDLHQATDEEAEDRADQ